MQTDCAGHTIPIIDPSTGVIHSAQIFVALPASSTTFGRSSFSQKLPDWGSSPGTRASLFSGVTNTIVCDNLKAGIAGVKYTSLQA
ncbi:hypothetical protein [Pararhizobium sp. LjRoot238]|uniref:hypothetical protein n=1 Tax=Pararhizobium sp. LjRoot238 TaxID=3342293 RepID=UPI003F5008A4